MWILKKLGFSKRKSFWNFFISYIIIIIVCLISVTIIYSYSINIIKTEIHTTSYAMIGQAKQTIDVRQKEINNLAFAISRNPRILDFSNVGSALSDTDRYNSIQIINDLQTYYISNQFIDDCYVYFKDSDLIINSQSRYNPRFFYDNIYKLKDISYEDWYVSLLNNYNNNNYLPSTPVNANNNGDGMVAFIQSIPYQEKASWYMNFVVMIKEDNIKKVLVNISDENSGNSYIITPDNKIITSVTANNNFKYIKYDELKGNEGFFIKKINNINMMVTYTVSAISKWKYVSAVPINIYLYKLNKLRDITLYCSIIFLVVGLMAAILFAYRDFAPIKRLFDSINSEAKNIETVNELEQSYTSIQAVVKKVINENTIFKTQRPVLQMSLFASLIRGELCDTILLRFIMPGARKKARAVKKQHVLEIGIG